MNSNCKRNCVVPLQCDQSCGWGVSIPRMRVDIEDGKNLKFANPVRYAGKPQVAAHPLYEPLTRAIEQAMFGKGERHGGASVPFFEQPWFATAKQHGVGFLTGQAAKKLGEAQGKDYDAWQREMLGAIVYMGMALLFEASQRNNEKEVGKPEQT